MLAQPDFEVHEEHGGLVYRRLPKARVLWVHSIAVGAGLPPSKFKPYVYRGQNTVEEFIVVLKKFEERLVRRKREKASRKRI